MTDEAVIEPSRERRRHGGVTRLASAIPDVDGAIGRPFRALDTLAMMEAKNRITPTMRLAGDHFHDLFRKAGLDGLYAADLRRVPVHIDNSSALWRRPISNEAAWWVVRTSLDALGGPSSLGGSCAWHVLGLEKSIQEFCLVYQWGRGGRVSQLDRRDGSGVLMTVLGILERHYRFVKP